MNIGEIVERPDVLNVYRYGSRIYGTADENSDHDYVVVAKEWFDAGNTDIHVFSLNEFKAQINNCNISVLECINLPFRHIVKLTEYFNDVNKDINKENLRKYISTISSNSWVKGKKKLIVTGDYDLRAGIKSVFHSLRILSYGIQLATDGKISSYDKMNHVYYDLVKLSKEFQGMELWENIDTKYRKDFNSLSSQFKALCPIDKINRNELLSNIMKKYGVNASDEMLGEILNIFDK